MTALENWIKHLIMLALLAGVVELLLPQSSLQRYARTALGFMVLLAVLLPVLGLMGQGVDWARAFAWEPPPGEEAAVADGVRRLQEVGRQLTLDAYRARVAAQVEAAAEAVPGVADARATVEVEGDPQSPRFGTIRAVRVAVSTARAAGEGIAPVRPVEVGPEGGPGAGSAGRGGGGGGDGQGTEGGRDAARLREAVAEAVMREFGLARAQVEVTLDR